MSCDEEAFCKYNGGGLIVQTYRTTPPLIPKVCKTPIYSTHSRNVPVLSSTHGACSPSVLALPFGTMVHIVPCL